MINIWIFDGIIDVYIIDIVENLCYFYEKFDLAYQMWSHKFWISMHFFYKICCLIHSILYFRTKASFDLRLRKVYWNTLIFWWKDVWPVNKKCDQNSGFIAPELQLLDPKIKIIVQQNVIYCKCKVQGQGHILTFRKKDRKK